ncbi:MAG: amidohydrolase [Bryobacterales bacterium]|nr:amidohydrolase [Bryobacterales bacterium]
MVVLAFLLLLAEPAADLVLTNARVWTANPGQPWTQSVAMRDGKIVRTGSNAATKGLVGPATQILDANGRLVIPGINDSHIHFLSGSLGLGEVDLTGACTLESIQARIRDWAKTHPDAPWVQGGGWEYMCFPGKRLPARQDLDAVVPGRPAFLSAYDGHTGWANSKAIEMAGVNKDTPFTGFGGFDKDPETGEPTGIFREGGQRLITRWIPPYTREQRIAALEEGLQLAASLGITSIQNASGGREQISVYQDLLTRRRLTVRVSMALSMEKTCEPFRDLRGRYTGPVFRVAAVKFVLDGVIESHTAAMISPYADAKDTAGSLSRTRADFIDTVRACAAEGWQIYTHAIGDLAVRTALDAYEAVPAVSRPRIEHIETIQPADISRFGQLGVLASMMPVHADPDTLEVWSRAIGPERLPYSFAWRSLEKAGARLIFSSDWPAVISVDPFRGIHNAVNRRTRDGRPAGGWLPEQRVSLETALRAYTASAAYASFEEGIKGQIRAGYLADMVVLSQDLFKIPPGAIHKTRADVTVFNGKVIYTRP